MLTTYPGAYEPPDNYVGGTSPVFLVADRFDASGRLLQKGSIPKSDPAAPPRMSALLSANFLFAPGIWVREVPYDPQLYFSGEEPTLAVRSWTHVWDMFGPSEAILWHRYGRSDRRLHWDDHPTWYLRDKTSLERYNTVMTGQDYGPYGLGTDRSLIDYQTFSGIDFTNLTLTDAAKTGIWSLSSEA